jgi:hypothetical protein
MQTFKNWVQTYPMEAIAVAAVAVMLAWIAL